MDHRAPLGGQRPRPPQRAVSGGYYGLAQPAPKRPTLPSRLSHIRSVSHPANLVDLTYDGTVGEKSNGAGFLGTREPVVRSPDVIKLEDDIEEPPAKRAKTSGESFKAEIDDADSDGSDRAHLIMPGSALPSLPKSKLSTNRSAGQHRHRFGVDSSLRRAHGLEPPSIATRVPAPKKAADFSPWTGTHPEDVLNENVVKTGFFDKVQSTNHTESNSAKAAMSSSLSQKNSHGLSLLGYLFTAVLEKRQVLGKCTAPSAFKPPPRVTVTDTKREAWLRDLANPDVPLRKQSRTIPHGIRGKLLMEQCLSKDIPMQRAVWLAKCVGANELRAFRRKGVSGSAAATGESKWVREWTVHVEQFLEDVIATCGQEGWQQKMNYAVKLATAFYSEKLLDAAHYLDWVVTCLADSSLERLPIWVILSQVYWKDVTLYGRRGRKLAEGLLEHLHRITLSSSPANALLKLRLQKLVAIMAVSNRGCLIIPRTWEKYKDLLTPAIPNTSIDTPAYNIAKRNQRLVEPMSTFTASSRSPLLDLYLELDTVRLDMRLESLATRSVALIPDIYQLVSALFNWASTRYRTGISRVYLAASLVAQLYTTGHQTDSAILQYLSESKSQPGPSIDYVHRVIVELVRLEAFSVSRYLQWLITSGVLSNGANSVRATKLVTAFGAADLPLHVRNTRNTLMRRLGYPLDESSAVSRVLESISDAISRSALEHVHSTELPEQLSLSARLNISQQTCAMINTLSKDGGIGIGAFGVARNVIETVQDQASLAALVGSATTSENCSLLATVADTINIHAESFTALGEFKGLVDALVEQYMLLRSQQPLDRSFILALTGLTQRISDKAAFVKLLSDDLAICEQQNSLAVCSPASDSLIGMHASNLDSDEDIDAVFASGNIMDEQLMHRVFTLVMQRASKPRVPGPELPSRICGWLSQLQSVEGSGAFENLVQSHVRGVLNGNVDSIFSSNSIVYLVAGGCLTLSAIAGMLKEVSSPAVAVDILRLFISPSAARLEIHEAERYRYLLEQNRSQDEHVEDLILLTRAACESPHLAATDPDLISFMLHCESKTPGASSRLFADIDHSESLRTHVGHVLTETIMGDRSQDEQRDQLDIQTIVSLADPLSISFCTRALQSFQNATSLSEGDERGLKDAMLKAFTDRLVVWPQLLEAAGETVNQKLHEWAQEQLLLVAMGKGIDDEDAARESFSRCLNLLAVTRRFTNATDDTAIVATIIERLKELERQLSELVTFDAESQGRFASLVFQLQITLDLCAVHVHILPNNHDSTVQGRYTLLAALCVLLVHWRIQSHQDLVEYLFDLSSTLSDNLPEAQQVLLQQQTGIKIPQDIRLNAILGTNSSALDSWLVLASQVQPLGSQQQRALNRHASQQHQPGGRIPAPGHGQPGLQPQHQRALSQGSQALMRQDSRMPVETKTTPFSLRRWEIMPEVMGENNTSLDLKLFGARKM